MDIPLFISPWRIAASDCEMSYRIEKTLKVYFSRLLQLIKDEKKAKAIHHLKFLREPKEIHLGYSQDKYSGKAIGDEKANHLYTVFSDSKAGKTSLLSDICNSQILVEGIGSDNVSDMIATICRGIFAEFTTQQCILNGVETYETKLEVFNPESEKWEIRKFSLPTYLGEHIILVPKKIISHDKYYSDLFDKYVIRSRTIPEVMKDGNQLSALSGLFRILKDDTKKPKLKAFYGEFSKSKGDLFDHVKKHGDLPLIEFKQDVIEKSTALTDDDINITISKFLDEILKNQK
ncbi:MULTISPECIES: hypothetical protein [Flavobacteriaceae]|uniref:hypothetical protein n=1 Tax=Flavobacteriaceae TaxID=49546 RepID=UPI001492F836|nr:MULTISPECIES: hypothetical protein [Allomuricauda]MDC6364697.1 hypothetical protein [Muricauda sp. AC10]